jgi:ribose transport system substrate-binding protein
MSAKRIALALVAVLTLALAACGEPGVDELPADEDFTVGLSISTLANPFFVTLRDGAQEAADAAGVELVVTDSRDDASTEADNLQDLIVQEVDVIIINPVDSDAAVASVEAANEAGIPVITVDRGVTGGEVASHIASDNVLGGRLATELLFELIGGSGKVAQLEGIPGTSAARDRGTGFDEALAEAEGIELATSVTANFSRDEGFTVAQDVFTAHPDLDGVFAQNDEMALGALEAAQAAGIAEDLVIVGFDAADDALAAIAAGEMDGTIAQLPAEMGRIALEQASAIAQGETVDAEIPVEVTVVTADNVDEFLSE